MPSLKDVCQDDNTYCCICEENECFVSLSPRGETILFVDGEEAFTSEPHCDCIIVLRRGDNAIEIYSVELKRIRVTRPSDARGALDPDILRQKCENCLQWIHNILSNFQSAYRDPSRIRKYCVIAIPSKVYNSIFTLIRREKRRYRPSISNGGRIILCNRSITEQAFDF